jgi:hypothetical protein
MAAGSFVARSRQVYIELVVEALLIVFLPEERADTHRHRKYNGRIVPPILSFSRFCPAESVTVSPISIYLLGRRCLPS